MIRKQHLLLLGVLFIITFSATGRGYDSITLELNTVESRELLDFYRFEGISHFKMQVCAESIKDKYFIISGMEYWNGELTKHNTNKVIANDPINA